MAFFDDEDRHVDRFGALLVVTVAAVVVLSLVDLREPIGDAGGELGTLVFSVFVGAMLLLALRAAGVARQWRLVADVVVGLGVATSLTLLVADLTSDRDLAPFDADTPSPIWAVMAMAPPVVVVHRLLRHRRVERRTLMGAVSALLLIGVLFCLVFLTVERYQDADFFGEPKPTTSFMYFSLVTLTTLGYGDLAPKTELGQLLAGVEAVLGQVYLVTFVAFLVSLYAADRARA